MSRLTEAGLQQMQVRMRAGRSLPSKSKRVVPDGASAAPSSPFTPLKLTITGQLPSGKNQVHVRRDGRHYPDKRFLNWRAEAHYQLLQQLTFSRPPITEPVVLRCEYWPKDKKVRDATGMLDALFHLLVYTKVLKDDGLVYDVLWKRRPVTPWRPQVKLEIGAWEP